MKKILSLLFFNAIAITEMHAQDSTNSIKALLDAKHYTFEPSSMTPTGGRTRQLNGGFAMDVRGDTLRVYLPYAGKAYSAPYNPSDAGYDFTSTKYEYSVKEGKKNKYEVEIKVKDRPGNAEFDITVYDNGTAYMRASSNDKSGISYNGIIKSK